MLSTWVYQYVHFSDRCGACDRCVHGGKCFDSNPLPPSPFLAPSPPWLPRLSFDLTFLENENRTASISVQLVKGQPRLMRWADGGMSVVFTYGGSDALCLLCLGDSPVVLHDKSAIGGTSRVVPRNSQSKIDPDTILELQPGFKCELRDVAIDWAPREDTGRGVRDTNPRRQDTNPPKKDGRRRCGACEGCVHGGKCLVIQAKWRRIKEQKEETALRVMERAKRALSESERVGVRACGDEDTYPTVTTVTTGGETDENDDKASVRRTVSLAHLRLLPVDEIDSKDEDSKDEDPPGLTCTTRWLTRDDLATSCATLVDRAMAPVREALRNAGNVDPDEIDDVVIVGGSSRLAVIRQRLSEAFHGRDIHHTVNPDTAIAVGAARSYAC